MDFRPKRFTEAGALKATNSRYRRIEKICVEIVRIWGDVDQGLVDQAEALRGRAESARLDAVIVVQTRAEEAAEREAAAS